MKKINIYIFSFLLLISSISFSDFNINFFSSYGFYNQDGLSPLLPNVGDGALVQLVYAGENDQIDEITDYELSTGDDVVISSFEVINDGSEFSEYAFGINSPKGTSLVLSYVLSASPRNLNLFLIL